MRGNLGSALAPMRTAEQVLGGELRAAELLTGDEELVLARRVSVARRRIRSLLRRERALSRAGLAVAGRGVVRPERDFREREALLILRFAEAAPGERAAAFADELRTVLVEYRVVRDQMVRAHVRLVALLARRYNHPTLSFLDLFQEGVFGLLRAVEKYDPARGVKFSTYAAWWIRQQLSRSADTQGALVRTPVHWNQMRRRVGRDGGASAATAVAALAEQEGLATERVETMTQGFQFVSTDALAESDGRPLLALLPDQGSDPETQAAQGALSGRLEHAVAQLPPREGLIVRLRFGLGDDAARTLEQISVRLGISRERVRQLEQRALGRLRVVCTEEGLEAHLH